MRRNVVTTNFSHSSFLQAAMEIRNSWGKTVKCISQHCKTLFLERNNYFEIIYAQTFKLLFTFK